MLRFAAFALALAVTPVAHAAPSTATSPPTLAPATLDFASQFDLTSKITGRTYRIFVSSPLTPAPKGGFPVLYVLDGNGAFPIANGQAVLSLFGGAKPVLVVGVGYPVAAAAMSLRNRDLTPTQPGPRDPGGWSDKPKPEDYGGADAFHRFMMEELRPAIASLYPVNASDQSLMGYSLGGLFTLDMLFKHPNAYRSFIAGSPSIWFNDREVLKGEGAFSKTVRSGVAAPRILITSDRWEQSEEAPDLPNAAEARTKALAEMARFRMVDNARELADWLKALPGGAGYEVIYTLFPEETHLTGIPAATSRGVAFVESR
jgi:predicted alpha/beta superfamily hydrolase